MNTIRKTVASRDGLDFVLSDETVDRMGDIIKADGWALANFKKNPIALFGHNSSFPIGTWSNLRIENGKLVGTLNPASRGTSARIDELLSLIDQDILRAVSVGFIPLKAEPIDEKRPYDGMRFLKQELLECSLCSVPANPAALQLAKSLNISDETLSLAFGEHADVRRKDVTANGEHAETTNADAKRTQGGLPSRPKAKSMKTLSQRIVDAQSELTAKKDKLAELTGAETLDVEAIEALTDQITTEERSIAALKASEAKIGIDAATNAGVTSPAIGRRPLGFPQRDVSGLDLLVRSIAVRGISHYGAGNKSIERVLEERYPGHEATAMVVKADQTVGTSTTSGWAVELVQTSYQALMENLQGKSIYPALRDQGDKYSFDGTGTVSIPSRTAGTAGGGWVAEGSPIRVGKTTTTAATFTSKKLGVIIPFTRELAKKATVSIEQFVKKAILEDTSVILDSTLLDATAASAARPAGLLYGVSAVASGYGGGDQQAVIADLAALMGPFDTANASDSITLIMHPTQARRLAFMPGPDGTFGWQKPIMDEFNIVRSTRATAGRLIAVRTSDFATALEDTPEFDISESATIHMEDTTPLEIVSGTGPTTADPVRSLWQTASVGVRMIMGVGWAMKRTGSVQWIDGTSW
jgi:HK97 family phage major capsid protein/HK97 family phage prohead protease